MTANKGFINFGTLLILTILIAALFLAVILFSTQTSFFNRATNKNLQENNNKVIQDIKAFNSGTEMEKSTLKTKLVSDLAVRQKLIIEMLKTDPEEVFRNSLSSYTVSLPKEAQALLENDVNTQGVVYTAIFDEKTAKFSKMETALKASNGETLILNFTGKPFVPNSGATIRIMGLKVDGKVYLPPPNNFSSEYKYKTEFVKDALANENGRQKILIVPVSLSSDDPKLLDPEKVKQLFMEGKDSVDNYYRMTSRSSIDSSRGVFLDAETTDWVSLPDASCDFWTLVDATGRALQQKGINIHEYRSIFIHVNPSTLSASRCNSYGAWGTINGAPAFSVFFGDSNYYLRTLIHELGHNFGANHANYYFCGDKPIDQDNRCSTMEYGDYFDIMGNYWYAGENAFGFNGVLKYSSGWISESEIKDINASGVYDLQQNSEPRSVTQPLLLRIILPNDFTQSAYYLSFRKLAGPDLNLPKQFVEGVTIIKWVNPIWYSQTNLINMNPTFSQSYQERQNAPLKDGQEFVDAINKIRIKQISHTDETAKLQITLDDNSLRMKSDSILGKWKRSTELPLLFVGHQSYFLKNTIISLNSLYENSADPNQSTIGKVIGTKVNRSGFLETKYYASLPEKLRGSQTAASDQNIYVVGGFDESYVPTQKVYRSVFDTNGEIVRWEPQKPIPEIIFNGSLFVYNRELYLIGGTKSNWYLSSSVYRTKIDSDGNIGLWQKLADLSNPISNSTPIQIDNSIYLFGDNQSIDNRTKDDIYILDFSKKNTVVLKTVGKVPEPLKNFSIVQYGKRVLIIGGDNLSLRPKVQTGTVLQNKTIGNWSLATDFPFPVTSASSVVVNKQLYTLGGMVTYPGSTWSYPSNTIYSAQILETDCPPCPKNQPRCIINWCKK